jgi:hypothetical protein
VYDRAGGGRSTHEESRTDSHQESETAAALAFANDTADAGCFKIPPRGVEQTLFQSRKRQGQPQGDVKSDVGVENRTKSPAAVDTDALSDLASRLASLPPEVVAALRALFGGEPRQP